MSKVFARRRRRRQRQGYDNTLTFSLKTAELKILRNFREQTQVLDRPTRVVLFESIQRGIAKCRG